MSIIKNNKNYGIETKITQAPPQVQYDQLIFTNTSGQTNQLNIYLTERFIKDCSYSLDEGVTWTALPADADGYTTTFQNINFNDNIYIRWNNLYITSSNPSSLFVCSKRFNISGDLYNFSAYNYIKLFGGNTELVDASGLIFHSKIINPYCCSMMFTGCNKLTTAPALPATALSLSCYYEMFYGCTALTTAPTLPATTLAESCYREMFRNCTSLVTPPSLPATTAATYCYASMFYGCTALTTAPTLPATTLGSNCYNGMFYGCTSLTAAPTLPATHISNGGYSGMFQGCTNLNTVIVYANTKGNSASLNNWLQNVSASGNFYNLGTYSYPSGASGIPSGWTEHTSL